MCAALSTAFVLQLNYPVRGWKSNRTVFKRPGLLSGLEERNVASQPQFPWCEPAQWFQGLCKARCCFTFGNKQQPCVLAELLENNSWDCEFCAKGWFGEALGRLLCEFLKLFQCWGKPWYAVFIFLCVKATKQQHHVISCMFPEPEIPALLQAALLIKQMWFVRLVSDSLSSLTAAVGKRTGLLRRCSESCKLVTQRRWTPASPRGSSSSIWCFCAFTGLRKVEWEPAQQIYRTARW